MKKGKQLVIKVVLLLVVWPLYLGHNIQAASFDCSKATTRVEKLICGDTALSRLDDKLAAAYKTALQDEAHSESIRRAQKQWLKERNACADAECVKRIQKMRLLNLSSPPATQDGQAAAFSSPETSTSPPPSEPLYGYCEDVMPSWVDCDGQSGKGYTVCETYLKHLNKLSEPPKCEAPVPPGFTEPEWEEVDFMQHLDWAYQIAKKQWRPEVEMSFEEWKSLFLKDIASGQISPQMRKTQVRPLVGESVTLLAFTDNLLGCTKPGDNRFNNSSKPWYGIGFLYFTLKDDPTEPLRVIEGGSYFQSPSREESVLLLYADKPYFVQGSRKDVTIMDITYFFVLSLNDSLTARQLCNFTHTSKRKKSHTNQTTHRR